MKRVWQPQHQHHQLQNHIQMLISIFTIIVLIEAKPSAYSYPLNDAIPNELLNIEQHIAAPTQQQQHTADDEISKLLLNVQKECLTGEQKCEDAVSMRQMRSIEHHMHPTVEPCVDFHQYACGNWPIVHANATTMMDLGEQRVTQRYADLFERHSSSDSSGSEHVHAKLWQDIVYHKMQQYYHICQANASFQQLGLHGYFEQIARLADWQQMHWLNASAILARFGYAGHLLKADVMRFNVTSHRLLLQTYFKKEQSNETPQQLEQVSVQLSDEIYAVLKQLTNLTLTQLSRQFVELENDLKAIATRLNEPENEVWLSYAQLRQRLPSIDWLAYFQTRFGRQLPESAFLQVDEIATLSDVIAYLNNANQQVLTLYILTRFFNFMEQQPHVPLHLSVERLNHQCIRHMRKVLYLPMIYLYEKAYYAQVRPASDRIINSIYEQLRAEFSHTLAANQMNFSADILEYLQLKLAGIRLNLGNLPQNLSDSFYAEYIDDLQLTHNFYDNHLEALKHFYYKQSQLLELDSPESSGHSQADESIWTTFNLHNPTMTDEIDATPYYYVIGNIIIMPYAYLQQPFYDYRFWSVLLYGDLANTLGHELLHAFDNTLIEYDHNGNMQMALGEAISTTELYKVNLQCLQQGTRFTQERIADISGTRLAINTFMRDSQYRRDNGKLYFLQFAQFFCGESDTHHEANRERLNYALQQTPEFAEVYQCPIDSPMRPRERCEMW